MLKGKLDMLQKTIELNKMLSANQKSVGAKGQAKLVYKDAEDEDMASDKSDDEEEEDDDEGDDEEIREIDIRKASAKR